jgi:hypothetical protein
MMSDCGKMEREKKHGLFPPRRPLRDCLFSFFCNIVGLLGNIFWRYNRFLQKGKGRVEKVELFVS